jgi:hypothetical protein
VSVSDHASSPSLTGTSHAGSGCNDGLIVVEGECAVELCGQVGLTISVGDILCGDELIVVEGKCAVEPCDGLATVAIVVTVVLCGFVMQTPCPGSVTGSVSSSVSEKRKAQRGGGQARRCC